MVASNVNGKPLAELRMELELGLHLWQVPDGYCSITRSKRSDGTVEYYYSACEDEFLGNTWEEMIETMSKAKCSFLWSTRDEYDGHPDIEDVQEMMNYQYQVEDRWQG